MGVRAVLVTMQCIALDDSVAALALETERADRVGQPLDYSCRLSSRACQSAFLSFASGWERFKLTLVILNSI